MRTHCRVETKSTVKEKALILRPSLLTASKRSVTSKWRHFYDSCLFVFYKWRARQRKRAGILSHQNSKPTPWWENLALFSASWRLGLNFVSIIAKSLPLMCFQLVTYVGIISLACDILAREKCQLKKCWGCSWCWCWKTFDDSLVQICKLRSGHKAKFCSDSEQRFGQDFEIEVQAKFLSWSLVSILLLIFGWGYEAESWSIFWS